MRQHIDFLKHLLLHKLFVFQAGRKIGCPLWRLLTHDLSKIRPSEWRGFVAYRTRNTKCYAEYMRIEFLWLRAVKLHHARNDHHWQHFTVIRDSGRMQPLPMPENAIREMVADWAGRRRMISGEWDVGVWWSANREGILLETSTRQRVEAMIAQVDAVRAREGIRADYA